MTMKDVIRNRLEVYRDKTAPLISYYQNKGLLVSVPAQGSVEEITERISKSAQLTRMVSLSFGNWESHA